MDLEQYVGKSFVHNNITVTLTKYNDRIIECKNNVGVVWYIYIDDFLESLKQGTSKWI